MPYLDDFQKNGKFIRTFDNNVNDDELVWHRDKRDRKVRVISGDGWLIQMDNELPIPLLMGQTYNIKKEVYHRIMKGKNLLRLEIEEL
jgi:hypothetical protein